MDSPEVPDSLERYACPDFRSGDRWGLVNLDVLDATLSRFFGLLADWMLEPSVPTNCFFSLAADGDSESRCSRCYAI